MTLIVTLVTLSAVGQCFKNSFHFLHQFIRKVYEISGAHPGTATPRRKTPHTDVGYQRHFETIAMN
jgi:hypothetical protein